MSSSSAAVVAVTSLGGWTRSTAASSNAHLGSGPSYTAWPKPGTRFVCRRRSATAVSVAAPLRTSSNSARTAADAPPCNGPPHADMPAARRGKGRPRWTRRCAPRAWTPRARGRRGARARCPARRPGAGSARSGDSRIQSRAAMLGSSGAWSCTGGSESTRVATSSRVVLHHHVRPAVVAQRVGRARRRGGHVEAVGDAGRAGEGPLGAGRHAHRLGWRVPGRRAAELAPPQPTGRPLVGRVAGEPGDVVAPVVQAPGRVEERERRVDHDVEPAAARPPRSRAARRSTSLRRNWLVRVPGTRSAADQAAD